MHIMKGNLTSSNIFEREKGDSFHVFNPSSHPNSNQLFSQARKSFKTQYRSSLVWLGSRENLVFALDTNGRLIKYDTLQNFKPTSIISFPSRAYKCMISPTHLYVISQTPSSQFCSFEKYLISDLQSEKVCPIPLLNTLQILTPSILEINDRDLSVTVLNKNTLQVFSLVSDQLKMEFPYTAGLDFRFGNDFLVFWEKDRQKITFGVLRNSQLKTFVLNTEKEVYFCEVVKEKMVLGVRDCHLQVFDLNDLQVEVIEKGIPIQIFNFSERVLAIYKNEVFVVGEGLERHEVIGNKFLCAEAGDLVLMVARSGEVYLNWEKIHFQNDCEYSQVCVNPDTLQIFLAEKGVIHILD